MTKEEFFDKINQMLPIERISDNFLEDVDNAYKYYLADVESLDMDLFENTSVRNEIIEDIKDKIKAIKSVLQKYLEGCHCEAFVLLKNSITNSDSALDIGVVTIGKTENTGQFYYRARINDGTIESFSDMFHIPNNKREIIKTERFSALGYPCLYLGNSAYDCWEEMGRPSFDELYFSGYKVVEEFKVYNLRKPNKKDFENEKMPDLLKRLVYVIACQFKVLHRDGHFKPEYIIPQLVIELIISSNRKKKETECGPYSLAWGVAYTSTHLADDFPYKEDYLENIAIPVINSDIEQKYCNVLMFLFEVSDPICYSYEELKEIHSGPFWGTIGEENTLRETYYETKLGFVERRIKENTKFNQSSYIVIDGPDKIFVPAEGGSGQIVVKSNDTWTVMADNIPSD